MNLSREENTKLFYNELQKKPCNFDLLYKLSLDGIFLYKPLFNYENIKYHKYEVSISIKYKQYFMINTRKQFRQFVDILKEKKSIILFNLVIPNKYFINKIVNDREVNQFLHCIFDDMYNIQLYYLFRYNFISYKVFDFFKFNCLPLEVLIHIMFVNEFYLKENKYLINLYEFVDTDKISSILKMYFDKDINALKYILNNITNKNEFIPSEYKIENSSKYLIQSNDNLELKNLIQSNNCCYSYFRISPYYPFDMLKEYSSKTYRPNILYFKHENKYIEDLFNSIYGDVGLDIIHNDKIIKKNYYLLEKVSGVYNIPDYIENYEILNYKEYYKERRNRYNNSYLNEDELWFGNKKLFDINFDLKKFTCEDNIYQHTFEEIMSYSKYFKKEYLNDNELLNILNDPEYIFYKYENDTDIHGIYFYEVVVRCCFIISLIYNRKSKFIVYVLSHMLNQIFEVTYDSLRNILIIHKMPKATLEGIWPEDYSTIIHFTLSTTNIRYNKLFELMI